MTPEESDKAYDEAPAIAISDKEIERLVSLTMSYRTAELEIMLAESNAVLRSAMVIAERNGLETNWEPFRKRLLRVLEDQHRLMYPGVVGTKYRRLKGT